MNQQLESKIIELAKRDVAEFEPLYTDTVADIFRYTYAICRNKELTEDIVSKTYLKAMQKISTYKDMGKPFKAWLFTIARNLLYNEFASAKPLQSIDESSEEISVEREEEILKLIQEESTEKISQVLCTLSKDIQELFFLKHEESQTFEEIAELQQQSISSVKMKYYRSLEKLKKELAVGEGVS